MKAQLVNRIIEPNNSIALQNHVSKNFLQQWHYHPEIELFVLLESTGLKFVGDNIDVFEPGEIILLGKNLPHLWQNDKKYFDEGSDLRARSLIIHFSENFAEHLLPIYEMSELCTLLEKSKRGIRFIGNNNEEIINNIYKMFDATGFERMMIFLEVLHKLSVHNNAKVLSSLGYLSSFKEIRNSKILPVYEYIMNNFKEDISLDTVASIANMNSSAFSRYFARIQKKTFTQFLNEIRIGYACKLLMEDKSNITGACYESGYKNVSNFNRQFKVIKGMSPSRFLKLCQVR
ncbi:MAG TPA: AraC family transcriptional regulator [Flavitalea sp.]|nr:AraC family transcriptional regulator [Flavitalea sp.]